MKIGELARQTGLSVDTLRFYEQEGLFAGPIRRNAAGRRLYTDRSAAVLGCCKNLRSSYRIVAGRVVRLGRSRRCGRGESCQRLLPTPTAHGLAAVGTEPECLCWLVLAAASTPPGWIC